MLGGRVGKSTEMLKCQTSLKRQDAKSLSVIHRAFMSGTLDRVFGDLTYLFYGVDDGTQSFKRVRQVQYYLATCP